MAQTNQVPEETIRTFARTIFREARTYGFGPVDTVRLLNALMDLSVTAGSEQAPQREENIHFSRRDFDVNGWPLVGSRIRIRNASSTGDIELIETWLDDEYGRHFLISCSTAQRADVPSLLRKPENSIGIVETEDVAIGAVAFLDIDAEQKRAELRKLIGLPSARGRGFAQEATALWIEYGWRILQLEKIFVSTLQTNLGNIRLNESIGFNVEGILKDEVLIDGHRYDVMRMGLCRDD